MMKTAGREAGRRGRERMYSYCVFCVTVKCEMIAAAIRQKFGYTAYSPHIVQRKWVKGQCLEEVKPYLPGYVFIYTEQPIEDFRAIRSDLEKMSLTIDSMQMWIDNKIAEGTISEKLVESI